MLKRLSLITAKLLRMTTYKQLLRGESQIKSIGVPVDITSEYRKFARIESLKLDEEFQAKKHPQVLKIIADKGNTF